MDFYLSVLETFRVAAEEGHFGRAAERVHLSQPALSRQIKRLEEQVGVALFERVGRGVELTRAGQVFFDYARRCLREYEQGVVSARRAAEGVAGTLEIGFVSPAIYANIIPRMVSRFRERAERVDVKLHELSSFPQARKVESGELDVAFLHPPIPEIELEMHVVSRQRFVAAIPDNHRLAGRGHIDASELAKDPFIIFPRERGPGLYDRIIAACQLAGFSPNVHQEAPRMQTIVSLVAAGIGVALVPYSVTQMGQAGVDYCELDDVDEHAILAAAWKADNGNPALSVFLDVIDAFEAQDEAT